MKNANDKTIVFGARRGIAKDIGLRKPMSFLVFLVTQNPQF